MNPIAENARILAFGDSLTYGFGAPPEASYPTVLSRLSRHEVINEGLNGEISREGRERLPGVLEHTNAKLLILCHGGNDILQHLSRAALRENLVAMVRMAKRHGMQVLLVGVPDISPSGLSALALYQEVARQEQVALLPDLLKSILSDTALKIDEIHPNAEGYRKMAEGIYEALKENHLLP